MKFIFRDCFSHEFILSFVNFASSIFVNKFSISVSSCTVLSVSFKAGVGSGLGVILVLFLCGLTLFYMHLHFLWKKLILNVVLA